MMMASRIFVHRGFEVSFYPDNDEFRLFVVEVAVKPTNHQVNILNILQVERISPVENRRSSNHFLLYCTSFRKFEARQQPIPATD